MSVRAITIVKPGRCARASKKAVPMAGRQRSDVDESTYSGRLAVRVRMLREAKGLTVESLADKLGCTVAALYTYEQGTRGIPLDLCPKLAKVLGCKSVDEFFPPLK